MKRVKQTTIVVKEHPKEDETTRERVLELWRKLSIPKKKG